MPPPSIPELTEGIDIPSLDAFYASLHLLHELQDEVARWRSAVHIPHYDVVQSSTRESQSVHNFLQSLSILSSRFDDIRLNIVSGTLGSATSWKGKETGEYPGYDGESSLWRKCRATYSDAYDSRRCAGVVHKSSGEDPGQYVPQIDELFQKLKFEMSHVPTFIDGSDSLGQLRRELRRLITTWKKLKVLS